MQEELEQKAVTLIINSGKLTGKTLARAAEKLLRFTGNRIKQCKHVRPKGKQSVKKLIAQNRGVETADLADKEERQRFDRLAKKFGVDYAIRKGVTERGEPRYILFFKGQDRQAIDRMLKSFIVEWKQEKTTEKSFGQTLRDLIRKASVRAYKQHKEPVR